MPELRSTRMPPNILTDNNFHHRLRTGPSKYQRLARPLRPYQYGHYIILQQSTLFLKLPSLHCPKITDALEFCARNFMVEFVHIAIDFDQTNLGLLPETRQQQIAAEARQFSRDLRGKGIPTIWVSFPKGRTAFDILPAPTSWPAANPRQRPKRQLSPAGLERIDIKTDEDIVLKGPC